MVLRSALLALLALLLVPGGASARDIIVKRDPGMTGAERHALRGEAGVRFVESLPLPRTELVTATDGDTARALRRLAARPDVEWAEPDRPVRALSNDPYFGSLWGLQNLGGSSAVFDADMDVVEAWETSTGAGRTVAVVDSGVDGGHADLAGRVAPGYDWVDDDDDAADANGHGTHVAGTIAAIRGNGVGGVGVAPDARILPLRVLDETGAGYTSDLISAFDRAGDLGVRVVNASLGGIGSSYAERATIASHPDTLFVVAAGNAGVSNDVPATAQFPCAYDLANVLCVGASTDDDVAAGFSNHGAVSVDLHAPGQMILSTLPAGGYGWMSGTSMATPHVAGEAALLLAYNPWLTTAQLKAAVLSSADAKAALSGLSVTGGRANANAALAAAGPPPCPDALNPICPGDPGDPDGDGVTGGADACPYEPGPAPSGCPGLAADSDGDGITDSLDHCPTVAGPVSANGCPVSDPDPPVAPPPTVTPTPPPTPAPVPPVLDADGDGTLDASDACPAVHASTANGCPLAVVTKAAARVRRRAVRLTLVTDRPAKLRVVVQRRTGQRWKRIKRRTATVARARVRLRLKRLKRGAYRVRVTPSTAAGRGARRTVRFRIR